MTEEPVSHIDVADLRQRGWTESLINRFLGQHDDIGHVEHYANFSGKRLYLLTRVRGIEKQAEFDDAFMRSTKRRKLDEKTIKQMLDARQ